MKLTETQYLEIKSLIESHDHPIDSFSIIKKKGWVHLVDDTRNAHIAFIRRKQSDLDPSTMQITHTDQYDIRQEEGVVTEATNWSRVIHDIDEWLLAAPKS